MLPGHAWRPELTLRFVFELLVAMALTGLVAAVAGRIIGLPPGAAPWTMTVIIMLTFHAMALALLALLVRRHGTSWGAAFGLFPARWPRGWLLGAVLAVAALPVAWTLRELSVWLMSLGSIDVTEQASVEAVRGVTTWDGRAVLFLSAVVTAPVVEEHVFRGVLYRLAHQLGYRRAGLVGVSALFAASHSNLSTFLPLLMVGVLWSWLYEQTGDLTAPILSHALFNGVNFAWIVTAQAT